MTEPTAPFEGGVLDGFECASLPLSMDILG